MIFVFAGLLLGLVCERMGCYGVLVAAVNGEVVLEIDMLHVMEEHGRLSRFWM